MARSALLGLMLVPALSLAAPQPGATMQDSQSGITFVYVPAGCFQMGSNDGSMDEQPVHQVCLQSGLWMGQTEVTQAQYEQAMGYNPSKHEGEDLPVERVTWIQANAMAERLSKQSGKNYRLPSEAEWEYACTAAGQHSPYCGDGELEELAWYDENSDEEAQPVAELEPNAWGLYDMSGNLREWLLDCWNPSYQEASATGEARLDGECNDRAIRGGSWTIDEERMRASNRNRNDISSQSSFIGFRLVLEP